MLKYKLQSLRAKFRFTEETLTRFIDLCDKWQQDYPEFNFVFGLDQIIRDQSTLFVLRNEWVLDLFTDRHESEIYFEDDNPLKSREQAIQRAQTLNKIIQEETGEKFYSVIAIDASVQAQGIIDVMEELNYEFNMFGIGLYLITENEEILIGSHYPTPKENLIREQQILKQYSIEK